MNETILLARDRKTGQDVILNGREDSFSAQRAAYKEFGALHDDYDRVGLYQLVPLKKPLKLTTAEEIEDRKTRHEEQVKAAQKTAAAKPKINPKDRLAKAKAEHAAKAEAREAAETALRKAKEAYTRADAAGKLEAQREISAAKTAARLAISHFDTAAEELRAAESTAATAPSTETEAAAESGLEFSRKDLQKLNQGELLQLAQELVTAGRLESLPEGKKSDLIAALLTAKPKADPNPES